MTFSISYQTKKTCLNNYNFRNTNSWHVAQWVSRDMSDTPLPSANLKKSDYSKKNIYIYKKNLTKIYKKSDPTCIEVWSAPKCQLKKNLTSYSIKKKLYIYIYIYIYIYMKKIWPNLYKGVEWQGVRKSTEGGASASCAFNRALNLAMVVRGANWWARPK